MRRSVLGIFALTVMLAEGAAAQTTFTPIFMSPYRDFQRNEFGAAFSDPGEGLDFALEGWGRYARPQFDLGLRVGFANSEQDPFGNEETLFLIGGDARAPLLRSSEDFPLDASFTVGLGGRFGDNFSQGVIPVGVSLGRRIILEGSRTTFVPFGHPVIAPTFGDGDDDLAFGLGLGVDININPNFEILVSGALGDYEGVGFGLAWHR